MSYQRQTDEELAANANNAVRIFRAMNGLPQLSKEEEDRLPDPVRLAVYHKARQAQRDKKQSRQWVAIKKILLWPFALVIVALFFLISGVANKFRS